MTKPKPSTARRLLVVEDDPDSLDVMAQLLRSAGHEVLTASSGDAALELLRGGASPDLILLDLWLADMSGFDFLDVKASWPSVSGVPVVLVTGDSEWTDQARRAGHGGLVACLTKPFDLEDLLAAIDRPGQPPLAGERGGSWA